MITLIEIVGLQSSSGLPVMTFADHGRKEKESHGTPCQSRDAKLYCRRKTRFPLSMAGHTGQDIHNKSKNEVLSCFKPLSASAA